MRLLPAERRLPRPLAADGGPRPGCPRRRLSGVHAHPRAGDRRGGRSGAGRAHRVGRHRGRGRRQRGRDVRGGDRADGRRARAGRAVRTRVPGDAAVPGPLRRRAPRHAARPRPADLLPRGGGWPGDGRVRAVLGAVGARRSPARRDPVRLQRAPARRGLAAVRGDRRQQPPAGPGDERRRDHAADQRPRGLHPGQRVLPRRDRRARLLRRRRLLRPRPRGGWRHRPPDGPLDRRRRGPDGRLGDGRAALRRALPLAAVHAKADHGGVRDLLRHPLPRPRAPVRATAEGLERLPLAPRPRRGLRREVRLGAGQLVRVERRAG